MTLNLHLIFDLFFWKDKNSYFQLFKYFNLHLLISIQRILRFYQPRHQSLLKNHIFILKVIDYLDSIHKFQEYYFEIYNYTKKVKEHFN